MSTFVLIHGACHGGWCWEKVIPILTQAGHEVLAPDLPGHGDDRSPISKISLQAYTDCLCKILDAQKEPAVLVGHSMGGIVISQTAEYRPRKIKVLVYLSAYLVGNGESLLQYGMQDKDSILFSNLIPSSDGSFQTIKETAAHEVFYGDCSIDDSKRAQRRLRPQASAPAVQPLNLSEEKYGSVPRIYIGCKRDRAVSPYLQERMYKANPCRQILSLDTGHSPFYAAPEKLADILNGIASQTPIP